MKWWNDIFFQNYCSCFERCSKFTSSNDKRSITRPHTNVSLSKSWVWKFIQCTRYAARCCTKHSIWTQWWNLLSSDFCADWLKCVFFVLFSVFGKAVLQCLGCILPFLDKDLIDNIPYLVASAISVLPPPLHQDIINSLCFYILPFTITRQSSYDDQECHSCQSVSAVIMMVFQYSNNPAHHCQLLECLMTLKQNVVKDLLCVIAYGTSLSRSSAAKLLFYYWPAFNANLFDRRGLLFKFTSNFIIIWIDLTKIRRKK